MLIWKKLHSDKSDFEAGGGFISQRFLLFLRIFWAVDENKVAHRTSLSSLLLQDLHLIDFYPPDFCL